MDLVLVEVEKDAITYRKLAASVPCFTGQVLSSFRATSGIDNRLSLRCALPLLRGLDILTSQAGCHSLPDWMGGLGGFWPFVVPSHPAGLSTVTPAVLFEWQTSLFSTCRTAQLCPAVPPAHSLEGPGLDLNGGLRSSAVGPINSGRGESSYYADPTRGPRMVEWVGQRALTTG